MKNSALILSLSLGLISAGAANGLWTNPKDSTLPIDFKIQGEYIGETSSGKKIGAQIIALDKGYFQAVLLPGGLPGAGWDGKNKSLLSGSLDGKVAKFTEAKGNRKYLAKGANEFSATRNFPPNGHLPSNLIVNGKVIEGKYNNGDSFKLQSIVRASKSIAKNPPKNAIILFDGNNKKEWIGGRVDTKTKLLNTDGKDIKTKRKFSNYSMHVEFMLPYKPAGRGQKRGNSGFYQVDHYEVQILDSFGLEGLNNECGGVYTKKGSDVNACLPPLQWQTYDINFTNAIMKDGKKIKNARMTARLNGIIIHDNIEINGKTGGSRKEPEGTPGPIKLQGHSNPLQFRNIWIVEK